MERDGLVKRSVDAADKRIVRVNLTQVGQEKMNKIAPVFFTDQSIAMSGLDENEIRSLVLLLAKLNVDE
jgi:DNA-binding MarR family transcriptional regulator